MARGRVASRRRLFFNLTNWEPKQAAQQRPATDKPANDQLSDEPTEARLR